MIPKKNFTVGLPEVSKLIDSAISKRQEGQRKQSFLEKKILHKREKIFTMNTRKYHIIPLMDCGLKQSTHHFHKIFFHISKSLACNAEKTLQLKITTKE